MTTLALLILRKCGLRGASWMWNTVDHVRGLVCSKQRKMCLTARTQANSATWDTYYLSIARKLWAAATQYTHRPVRTGLGRWHHKEVSPNKAGHLPRLIAVAKRAETWRHPTEAEDNPCGRSSLPNVICALACASTTQRMATAARAWPPRADHNNQL
ncbi:hypothetical protein BC628DRAFT_713009 [Trametes gibbosa]|nr:hypothetical protein BC628DRAFT_713009 [Trametes gibbosa]